MTGEAKVNIILELKNRLKAGLPEARSYLKSSVDEMKANMTDLKSSTTNAFSSIESGAPSAASSLGGLATAFGIGSIAANVFMEVGTKAIEAVSEVVKESIHINEEWEMSFAKTNSMLQLSQDGLKGVSDQVDRIAASQGAVPYEKVPDAFNEIIKSGEGVQQALQNLPTILQAARAGFIDAGIAAKTTTEFMNEANIKDAAQALDIMFATMHKGNMDLKTVGNTLPEIILAAKKAHIGISEAAGALATLTSKGVAPDQAATMLEETFRLFTDTKRVGLFNKMGIQINDAKGNMRSLADITRDFSAKLSTLGNDTERNKFFDLLNLDSRSGQGFLTLAQDAGQLRENVDAIANSQGELNKQTDNTKSETDSWHLISNQIKHDYNLIGEYINTAYGKIGDAIINTYEWATKSELVQDTWKSIKDIVSIVGDSIKGVASTIELIWTNSLKPVFDKMEKAYKTLKGISELGNYLSGHQQHYKHNGGLKIGTLTEQERIEFANDDLAKSQSSIINMISANPKQSATFAKQNGYILDHNKFGGFTDDAWKKISAPVREKMQDLYHLNSSGLVALKPSLDGVTDKTGSSKSKADAAAERIQGSTPRTVNFNIQSVVSGDFITKNENFQNMSPKDFEKWLTEIFLRMQHNAETGYN